MRVQIPVYTDAWMKGDRYGEIVKTYNRWVRRPGVDQTLVEYAVVKLDKSGKRACVLLNDCTPV